MIFALAKWKRSFERLHQEEVIKTKPPNSAVSNFANKRLFYFRASNVFSHRYLDIYLSFLSSYFYANSSHTAGHNLLLAETRYYFLARHQPILYAFFPFAEPGGEARGHRSTWLKHPKTSSFISHHHMMEAITIPALSLPLAEAAAAALPHPN